MRTPPHASPLSFILAFTLSCAQPTDSPDEGVVERERVDEISKIGVLYSWQSLKLWQS